MPCDCRVTGRGGICVCVFESSDEFTDEFSSSAQPSPLQKAHDADSSGSDQTITAPPNSPRRPIAPNSKDSVLRFDKAVQAHESDDEAELTSPKRAFKLIQLAEKLQVVLKSPNPTQYSYREESVDKAGSLASTCFLRMHNLDTEDFERVEKWKCQVDYQRICNPLDMDPLLPFQGLYGRGLEVKVGITPTGMLTPSIFSNSPLSPTYSLVGHTIDRSCRLDGIGWVTGSGDASAQYINLLGAGPNLPPHYPNWQNDSRHRESAGRSAPRPKFLPKLFL